MTQKPDNPPATRIPCPRCGAKNEQTAESKCQPIRDYTDEYTCPMTYVKTDSNGYFIGATEATHD
jgi:hypothetical protein